MGRPWWYDSYWEKRGAPGRRARLPRRQTLVWLAMVVLALLLAAGRSGWRFSPAGSIYGFVYYLCRILSVAVVLRALLSWFMLGGYNLAVRLLDDATEPILRPLRRVVPLVGRFDLTPLVAILLLYLVPFLLGMVLL